MANLGSAMEVVDERSAVLHAAAEAVAKSLISKGPLKNGALAEALRDILLAENADANEATEARCKELRRAFTAEVQRALSRARAPGSGVEWPLYGHIGPLRVEVRGTAGRLMRGGTAFTVGRAPECDVQAIGDPTVLPLQCVIVPLPCGILVADLWSAGGPRATWHGTVGEPPMPTSPTSSAAQPAAFIISWAERVTLHLGTRTTVTLGSPPKLRQQPKQKGTPPTSKCTARVRPAAEALPPSTPAKVQKQCVREAMSQTSTSFGSPESCWDELDTFFCVRPPSRLPQDRLQELPADRRS